MGPIISSLVIALCGVVAFQSLKDDIRATEARLVANLKDFRAELKADNRSLNDKLDQVLENLWPCRPAARLGGDPPLTPMVL